MSDRQTPLVVVFSTAYLPFQGGAEIAIDEITQRAEPLRFLILTARASRALPRREARGNVVIERIGLGTRFDKWLLPFFAPRRVKKVLREGREIVLWGMMISQATLGAYYIKRRHPEIPFIVTLQEGDADSHLQYGRMGLIRFFWRRVLRVADTVTVISTYLGERARTLGYAGEILLVPNGVREEFLTSYLDHEMRATTKTSLGISPQSTVLLSVSRLVKKNGLKDLIRAVMLLREKHPNIQLVVVGEGSERKELEKYIQRLECGEYVHLAGDVSHDTVLRYYQIADVFARPSYSEGLGSVFLEAMGAGLPVVATPVGGIVDIVKDRETGLFADVGNPASIARCIDMILSDQKLRTTLIHNGRTLVQKQYLWATISADMLVLFNKYLL